VVAPTPERAGDFVLGELMVTPLGREVLTGKRDWQTINRNSRWLGGVEITPGAGGWRWDPDARALVAPQKQGPAGRSKK
jgi:hypothetical protein